MAVLATALAILAVPAAAHATALTYQGGPVMHSARTVLVDWTSNVRSTYSDPGGDPGFLQSLAAQTGSPGDVTGVLAQYGDSTGHNYSSGSYANQFVISPSKCTGTTPCPLDDTDIKAELASQVSAGHLPGPRTADGRDTVYVILFPANVTICMQGSCSGSVFCAYHSQVVQTPTLLYAVMPDNGPGTAGNGGCGNSATDLNNQTSVLSHEWAETINDPLVASNTLSWYDNTKGEIADICNAQQATNGSYTVQKLWSNAQNACVATASNFSAPTAAFAGPTGGFATDSLAFDGSTSTDPIGNTGGTPSTPIGHGIASYSWDWGDGTSGSGATPSHAYSAAGTYNVTLTVTDNLGFTNAVTHPVTVAGKPPPPAPAAPDASVAPATGVGATAATLNGHLDPHGGATSYVFEYGTTTAYGQSTPAADAGTGPSDVSAAVSGLLPGTTYHYRLTATNAGGVASSGDGSFTTAAAAIVSGPGPALVLLKPRHQSLRKALSKGLKVGFTCGAACTVKFTIVFANARGKLLGAATPVTLAQGTGRLTKAGAGTATVRFTKPGKRTLAHKHSAKLKLNGVPTGAGGAAGTPQTLKITLSG